MKRYLAILEQGVFIAPWSGDPGRTLDFDKARLFIKKSDAWRAIEKAQKYRKFKSARVEEITD